MTATAQRAYQLRGYCRRGGYERLRFILDSCRELYNAALQERRDAWRLTRTSVGYKHQSAELTGIRRDIPEWGDLAVEVGRGVLRRIDRAYAAFFRRVKAGERPGYPRFKSAGRYRTIELSEVRPHMVRTSRDGRRAHIRVKGLPTVEVRLKRELPPPEHLRALRLAFRAGKLYVDLAYEVEMDALPPSDSTVGIDLGVNARVALSDGTLIAGTKPDRRRERRLRRRVSRSRKGSKRHAARVAALGRETHRNRVAGRHATHRLTTGLVRDYGRIAIEDLQIQNMTRSARGTVEVPGTNVAQKRGLNRGIAEQSWGLFRVQLTYKAAWAGRELVAVDPKHTSQDCSRCGARSAKATQREYRVYRCTSCGLVLDRDVNAARNIAVRAFGDELRESWDTNGAGDSPRSAQPARAGALAIVA